MRSPNHIVLDFESSKNVYSERYWVFQFLSDRNAQPSFVNDLSVYRKVSPSTKTPLSALLKGQKCNTVRSNLFHPAEFVTDSAKDSVRALHAPKENLGNKKALEHYLKYSKSEGRDSYMYLTLRPYEYTLRNVRRLLKSISSQPNHSPLNTWFSLVNVNFLRKERIYTKLKYSRTPAYDIVSGGAAALLAGFIGFLVSEKFGFELVDSGDFYYAFMFAVFTAFSLKPLLTVADPEKGFLDLFSLRRVYVFFLYLVSESIRFVCNLACTVLTFSITRR